MRLNTFTLLFAVLVSFGIAYSFAQTTPEQLRQNEMANAASEKYSEAMQEITHLQQLLSIRNQERYVMGGIIAGLIFLIVWLFGKMFSLKNDTVRRLEAKRTEMAEYRARIHYLEKHLEELKEELETRKASENQIKSTAEKILDFAHGKLKSLKSASTSAHSDLTDFLVEEELLPVEDLNHLRKLTELTEAGNKEATQSTTIESIVKRALQLTGNTYDPEKITFKLSFAKLPDLSCHPKQLSAAFAQILDFSIHSIKDKGTIVISSYMSMGDLQVSISDNGEGCSESLSRSVMRGESGKMASNEREKGLYESRKVIEEDHGGKMEMGSVENVGTEFVITLPSNK
ncbi:ATP-binding protein [Limibacter armeniacum]|uniref:ATP-binding protein n=1 Tax=Limibacter armeniacum TaxID=466084 RepID=UPI002FE66EE3